MDPIAKLAPFNYRAWDRADGGDDLQKRFDCTIKGATAADDFRNEPNHLGYVGEFYLTLTNNSTRGLTGTAVDAANPRTYEDAKGMTSQKGNVNGHILRLRETGSDGAATTFSWDVYLFGAQVDANATAVNLSSLTADSDFSSPDGLCFDARGVLWIQTDDGAYTDVTNCMMLAAAPGQVGDGAETMVGSQKTLMGKKPGVENLKRFLVGVPGCEITGVDMTPDLKAMFVCLRSYL